MEDKFILQAEESVLLIVDIQQGTLLDQMPEKELMVKNSCKLIKIAEELEIPIVVTEQYPKGIGPTAKEIKACLPMDTPMIEKMTFDACTDELLEVLNKLGRSKIIMVGLETHICVFQTTRGLLQRNYQVQLVTDALQSRSQEHRLNAMETLQQMGAVATNHETVIFDLLKVAGTAAFKKILPLLK